MSWKRVLFAWTALLALMFASAGASARADVSPKPHVVVIDLVVASGTRVNDLASVEEHRGKRCLPTAGTSDVPHAERGGMLGAKGTQTTSTTVYKVKGGGKKGRIDVENPNPGQRPGQIHFQRGREKYLYDPATKTFPGAPRSVNKLLSKPEFQEE